MYRKIRSICPPPFCSTFVPNRGGGCLLRIRTKYFEYTPMYHFLYTESLHHQSSLQCSLRYVCTESMHHQSSLQCSLRYVCTESLHHQSSLQCSLRYVCTESMHHQSSLQCPLRSVCTESMHHQSSLQCPCRYVCTTASVDLLAYTYTIVPEAEVNTGEYSLVYKPRRSRSLYNK